MSQARPFTSFDDPNSSAAAGAKSDRLSKLVYRSRAVQPMSPLDLQKLTLAAQARNRAEAVTGLVLHDEGSFFQWLEGPREGVERVFRSIRNNSRHTDIKVLDDRSAETRAFADCSMKLATTAQADALWRRDAMEPPQAIIAELRRNPDSARPSAPGAEARFIRRVRRHGDGVPGFIASST